MTTFKAKCKHKDDIDILRKECKSCCELFIANEVYGINDKKKLYCKLCKNQHENYAYKEYFVKDMLDRKGFSYIHNSIIRPGVCKSTMTRPDFLVTENPLFKIVIEVDENQHSGYKKMCDTSVHKEIARMISIKENDLGGSPLVFIRFNPDKYKSHNILDMANRLKVLRNLLYSLKHREIVLCDILVYYLFYDGYDGIKESPLTYVIDNGIKIKHTHPKYPDIEEYQISLE